MPSPLSVVIMSVALHVLAARCAEEKPPSAVMRGAVVAAAMMGFYTTIQSFKT